MKPSTAKANGKFESLKLNLKLESMPPYSTNDETCGLWRLISYNSLVREYNKVTLMIKKDTIVPKTVETFVRPLILNDGICC